MAETIYAVSSGQPPSAIAVFRISGPQVRFVVETLTRKPMAAPRHAALRVLYDADLATIDRALVLWFPGPASFTGDDVAELHVHGGRAVVARLAQCLGAFAGVRPARAGEFTRAAFGNGRIDLTGVEALSDLIAAETEEQRRAAIAQGEGGLRERCDAWRDRLIAARAWIEASIDFSDEADIPEGVAERAWHQISGLADEIGAALMRSVSAERIRDGLVVVLTGAPNAGKSSLLNALVGREVAIVSDEPGTTRDLIEVDLDLGGFAVRLIDTAGLRAASGAVEREGIRRALERAARADLVLHLVASDSDDVPIDLPDSDVPVWRVASKIDMIESHPERSRPDADHAVSVLRPGTLDVLVKALVDLARTRTYGAEPGLILHERQRALLVSCLTALQAAGAAAGAVELAGEELRRGGDALAGITGAIGTEDVLGRIFSTFCVGK